MARPNLRKHNRQRMRRAAWLSVNGASTPIRCVVWDISKGGCRLAAPHTESLPEIFVVDMRPTSQDRFFCRVIWRKDSFVGVEFIKPAEAERLFKGLSDSRTTSRGLYWKEDRASWSEEYRKPNDVAGSLRESKSAGKRPKFNIQLY